MQTRKHMLCCWEHSSERAHAYCHLFDGDCSRCLFNTLRLNSAPASDVELVFPGRYYLSPGHLWVAPSSDGTLLVGIDKFIGDALFHVRSFILPACGTSVQARARVGWLIDLIGIIALSAPATGKIVAQNTQLHERPGLMRGEPYGCGWLYEMHPDGQWQHSLMDGWQGCEMIKKAKSTLKDKIIALSTSREEGALLSDGGELSLHEIIKSMPQLYLRLLTETINES